LVNQLKYTDIWVYITGKHGKWVTG